MKRKDQREARDREQFLRSWFLAEGADEPESEGGEEVVVEAEKAMDSLEIYADIALTDEVAAEVTAEAVDLDSVAVDVVESDVTQVDEEEMGSERIAETVDDGEGAVEVMVAMARDAMAVDAVELDSATPAPRFNAGWVIVEGTKAILLGGIREFNTDESADSANIEVDAPAEKQPPQTVVTEDSGEVDQDAGSEVDNNSLIGKGRLTEKQVTMDDCWRLDLSQMRQWEPLSRGTMHLQVGRSI